MSIILDGTTGISTPSVTNTGADSAASQTLSGNLVFTGTGNRITGDFSNATLTNRVTFQSSTTNGTTAIQVIPNGTATQTQYALYTDASIANGNYADLTLSNTVFRFRTNLLGTGTAVPMTFETGGSERIRIDTSGNVGIGTNSPAKKLHVVIASAQGTPSSGPETTLILQNNNVAGSYAALSIVGGQSGRSMIYFSDKDSETPGAIQYDHSANALFFTTNDNTERMRIDSTGNITSTGSISDSKGDVRNLVNNAQSGAYALVAADNGKMINITTGGVTVSSGIFSAGNNITIFNNSGSSQTITASGVTMYLAGTATTGNRTLAQRGIATIVCVASNTFVISGSGVT